MEEIIDNKYYKFTPSKIDDFYNINKKDMIIENDIYQKFNASAETFGELIICNDTSRMIKKSINFTSETYSEYLTTLEKRDPKKDVWIYNIINGIYELLNDIIQGTLSNKLIILLIVILFLIK